MKVLRNIPALLVLGLLPQTLLAQDSNFGVGVQAGTTGAGVGAAVALTDHLNLRAAYNVSTYDTDFDDTGVSYDAEFNKDSISLLLDWHPTGNSFRLSAGAFNHPDNNIEFTARPASGTTYTINGTVYDATNIASLTGEANFKKTTPYVGLGWGNISGSSTLTFMLDVGVQFQNSPDINLVASNCTLPGTLCTQLITDIETEVLELEADAEDFDLWPVVNLGLHFRF